jgi:hypothetical protein
MLGGIDTGLFLTGLGGFFVVVFVMVPLMKWVFPSTPSERDHRKLIKQLRREVKELKKK